MKPWHLHSEAERDRVLTCLDVEADWQIHHYQAYNRDYADALRAAAAVLRDAALLPCSGEEWPDEALVVSCATDSEIGEILDTSAYSRFVVVRWQLNGDHDQRVDDLVALTPAAAEFLAALDVAKEGE